jgi:hypothetical protein
MFIFRRSLAAVAAGLGAALLTVILDRACERSGPLAAEGHGGAMDRPLPRGSQSQGADALRGEVNSCSEFVKHGGTEDSRATYKSQVITSPTVRHCGTGPRDRSLSVK